MAKKIVKKNLVDQVTEFLQEAIESGEYQVGDKLPSENDLANEFGTSRLTVRLAIQKLNAIELLETKVGDGTYVKRFSFEKYIDNVSDIIFSEDMMGDIREFRDCIEKRFSLIATKERTETELEELRILCEEFEAFYHDAAETLSEDLLDKLAEKDFEIHMKICQMSHNALYKITYQTMRTLLINYMKEIILTRKKMYDENHEMDKFLSSLKTHRLIYAAIRDQDTESCLKVLDNMINYEVLMNDNYL